MVKGHERKSYQPSSSAKAAQLVASSGPKGGFGFGGFSGATPIASAVANSAPTEAETSGNAAPAPALTGELDSKMSFLSSHQLESSPQNRLSNCSQRIKCA
ncbi:TPA: hypothetical protein ACH3X2_002039 [Trebouxia sp. C0005]